MKSGAMISGGPGEKPVNQKTAKSQHSPSAGHLAWADYVTNEEGIANHGEQGMQQAFKVHEWRRTCGHISG